MRYRKVSIRVWNDEKFRALSDDAKLAFFFCLTHPHMTPLGAMRATPNGLAEELGWENGRMETALDALAEAGTIVQNRAAAFLWFPKFLSHNPPESPNVVTSWAKTWELIPECPERGAALESAHSRLKSFHKGYLKAFLEAFREALGEGYREGWGYPSPNQEQEQEQEQEKISARARGARDRAETEQKGSGIVEGWEAVRALLPKTQKKLADDAISRWQHHGSMRAFHSVREALEENPGKPATYIVKVVDTKLAELQEAIGPSFTTQ